MSSLWTKRRRALWKIAGVAGANVAFSGAPKPGAEIPAHIVLTAGDFVMCGLIYEEYFGEKLTKDDILEVFGAAGLLLIVAGGGGYAIAKGATGILAEFTNLLGPLGWMASGILAAGGTGLLGFLWMAMVDYAYRNKVTLKQAARAVS